MRGFHRRALLVRAGSGVGLGGISGAVPSAAETDLSSVRLVCSSKRLSITWYTRWLDAAPSARPSVTSRKLVRELRRQEQTHYALLAPLLGTTAPRDDDFDFKLPPNALRSSASAAQFSLDLEKLIAGIGIGACAAADDRGIAESLARVAASDAQHVSALGALVGLSPLEGGLVRSITLDDASNQLDQFLA